MTRPGRKYLLRRAYEPVGTAQETHVGRVSYAALTPLSFLQRSARVWPRKVAVIYGSRPMLRPGLRAPTWLASRAS